MNLGTIFTHQMLAVEEPNSNARWALALLYPRLGRKGEIKDFFHALTGDPAARIVNINVDIVFIMACTDSQLLELTFVHGVNGIID